MITNQVSLTLGVYDNLYKGELLVCEGFSIIKKIENMDYYLCTNDPCEKDKYRNVFFD